MSRIVNKEYDVKFSEVNYKILKSVGNVMAVNKKVGNLYRLKTANQTLKANIIKNVNIPGIGGLNIEIRRL